MHKSKRILSCLLFTLGVCVSPQVSEAQWGHLKGQLVLDGEIPKPKIVFMKGANVKDAEVCAVEDFVSDELVVDPETKGIANIFIYMRRASKVHPDLQSSTEKTIFFDQKTCRFKPHAMLVRTDQTVKVLSDDPVPHNTHSFTLRNVPFNILIPANTRADSPNAFTYQPRFPESLPMQIKCDLHPHMQAYWLILDHPYAAVSKADGSFQIENLPAGEHEFRVWHEKVGYVEKSFKVTIADGETNDVGAVKVDASKFE